MSELAFVFMMTVFLVVVVKLLDTVRQIFQDKKVGPNNKFDEKRYCKKCKGILSFFDQNRDSCQICEFQKNNNQLGVEN